MFAKKSFLASVLIVIFSSITYAAPVTVEQAGVAAKNFLVTRYPTADFSKAQTKTEIGSSEFEIRGVVPLRTENTLLGYVVRLAPGGYILLTADDQAPPVKLHSDDGSFEKLPPGFRAVIETEMLEDLTRLFSSQAQNTSYHQKWDVLLAPDGSGQSLSEPSVLAAGVPILTTTWNQDNPYNYYCPEAIGGPNDQAYAGCVSTALAQILRHHYSPVRVANDYSYTDSAGSCTGTHNISDAGMANYNWADMPASISPGSSESQKQAVGQLIYHCAVALEADFEADETAAFSARVPTVLWQYFGYSGTYESKSDYNSIEWYNKIAIDIDANHPVYYGMEESDGTDGHAVVCDGYRDGNEIHLNLGWSGEGNAWYNIDSVSYGGYTWTIHEAVFEIVPDSWRPPMTIYVNASATGANNGSGWADAYTSLQSALSAAFSGDEIWVARGTYEPTTYTDRTQSFVMKEGVAVYGGFFGTETNREQRNWSSNQTILSGDIGAQGNKSDNSYHVVKGANDSILDGFTITDGNANDPDYYIDQCGGGMLNVVSSPAVANCIFIGNSTSALEGYALRGGGGMFNHQCNPIIINCTFSNNSATTYGRGGGMFNDASSPTVSDCAFIENTAGYSYSPYERGGGGGMFNQSSNPIVTNSTFNSNSAVGSGGGMFNNQYSSPTVINCAFNGNAAMGDSGGIHNEDYSNAIFTDCTFSENTAIFGGGMFNLESSPIVTYCTFSKNVATGVSFPEIGGMGGGMLSSVGSPIVTNCIFNGNLAYGPGGGDRNESRGGGMYIDSTSTMVVTNCAFSGNSAGVWGGGMFIAGGSPMVNNCTFSQNLAGENGGGMFNWVNSSPVANCIFWDNNAPSGPQIYNMESSPAFAYSCIEDSNGSGSGWDTSLGTDGGGNIDADPLFIRDPNPGLDVNWGTADDDYGNLRLRTGSPCIDAGDNNSVPLDVNYDLAGNPRIGDANCDGQPIVDMGAFEFNLTGDLSNDCQVDLFDIDLFTDNWLETSCAEPNNWCDGADIDKDNKVTLFDFADIAEDWLSCTGEECD